MLILMMGLLLLNQSTVMDILEEVNGTYNFTDYVDAIVVKDFGIHRGFCGFYPGFGRKILWNINPRCNINSRLNYKNTLIHEVRHSYFFRVMSPRERVKYCDNLGLRYGLECWEHYAENFIQSGD